MFGHNLASYCKSGGRNTEKRIISHAAARISEKEKEGASIESFPKEGLLELN